MACERDRIVNIITYLESLGIQVNIGKNKARGNKGFFKVTNSGFRIDIAKNVPEAVVLKTLAHEFAHFVHYNYDKTLTSLDFIFKNTDDYMEELIEITVDSLPKDSIRPLFDKKSKLKEEIDTISDQIYATNPMFDSKITTNRINRTPLKYLLKHDRVKVINGFSEQIYSITELKNNTEDELYLILKSKQRAIARINSRISRLNRYYNSPSELFARSLELYLTNPSRLQKIAPNVYTVYQNTLSATCIPILNEFCKKFLQKFY